MNELESMSKPELLEISRNLELGLTFKAKREDILRKIEERYKQRMFFKDSVYIDVDDTKQEKCTDMFKKWQIGSSLKKGGYGSVSEACRRTENGLDCNYILKAQNITQRVVRYAYTTEVEIFKDIKGKNIGPELISDWNCEFNINMPGFYFDQEDKNAGYGRKIRIGYILMERWDGTLSDFINQQGEITEKQLEFIEGILLRFHSLGWVHRDTKLDNFLYKVIQTPKGSRLKFGLTDFSISERIDYPDDDQISMMMQNPEMYEEYDLVKGYQTKPEIDFLLFKVSLDMIFGKKTNRFDKYIKKILKN